MIPQHTQSRKSHTSKRPASNRGDLGGITGRQPKMQRPENYPVLLRIRSSSVAGDSIFQENCGQKFTKLLLKVTIQRSLGPVHVVMSPESFVEDLVKVALETYVKEKRRPLLIQTDPRCFELHYSQFSLESLNPKEKLINVGSRNFFLYWKPIDGIKSSCSDQAKNAIKCPFPLCELMDLLL